MLQLNVKTFFVVLLMGLAVLLTGCATSLPTPAVESPSLPTKPSVATQTPSVSYSESARQRIETWQNRLTESIATDKP